MSDVDPIEAVERALELWRRDPEKNASDEYERVAAIFYAETGLLAPGKDARMGPSTEERSAAYNEWATARIQAGLAALPALREERDALSLKNLELEGQRSLDTYKCGHARQSDHDQLTCCICENAALRARVRELESMNSATLNWLSGMRERIGSAACEDLAARLRAASRGAQHYGN